MASNTTAQTPQNTDQAIRDGFFENLISGIKFDKLKLDQGIMHPDQESFYHSMMAGDINVVAQTLNDNISRFQIYHLIKDYLIELNNRGVSLLKLAFHNSNSKIRVWTEIATDDEKSEKDLVLAESAINLKYYDKDFHLYTTIVEADDQLPVPPQYQEVDLT